MGRWIALAGLVGVFLIMQLSSNDDIGREQAETKAPVAKPPVYDATRAPGRVVELYTNKGQIDIVLFEEDCPKSTRRIADMVAAGAYDGVVISRVENELIQTQNANARVKGINLELVHELKHIPGAVGMARTQLYDSNGSSFYILKSPLPQLDGDYTVFGHVVKGLDVVKQIESDDVIRTARLRRHTADDIEALNTVKLASIKREPRPLDPEFIEEPDHAHEEGSGCCPGH